MLRADRERSGSPRKSVGINSFRLFSAFRQASAREKDTSRSPNNYNNNLIINFRCVRTFCRKVIFKNEFYCGVQFPLKELVSKFFYIQVAHSSSFAYKRHVRERLGLENTCTGIAFEEVS